MRKLSGCVPTFNSVYGTYAEICSRYEESFGEDMARFYLAEITLAVHSVHSMGFVHR
jgi:serine/threonine protein kinase